MVGLHVQTWGHFFGVCGGCVFPRLYSASDSTHRRTTEMIGLDFMLISYAIWMALVTILAVWYFLIGIDSTVRA